MPVPITYRKSGEGSIATYSFYDIGQGTGIVTFYGAFTKTNGVSGAVLTTSTIYSDVVSQLNTPGTGAYVKVWDIDFDASLNAPLTLKGAAVISVPISVNFGAGNTAYVWANALIRKWDGTTETEIASASGAVVFANGDGTRAHQPMTTMKIDVPLTHFKKGETLRLTIEGYTTASTGGLEAYIAHDPMNRSVGFTTGCDTKLVFNCPVRINA